MLVSISSSHLYQLLNENKTLYLLQVSKRGDDSDDDTECALSENWTYEKKTHRWSRIGDQLIPTPQQLDRLRTLAVGQDCQFDIDDDFSENNIELGEFTKDTVVDALQYQNPSPNPGGNSAFGFRRTGSERLRDGAKAFLRRMESLKSRKRKQITDRQQQQSELQEQSKPRIREGLVITSSQIVDVHSMQQRMRDMNCAHIRPEADDLISSMQITASSHPTHPLPSPSKVCNLSAFGDDSSSYRSDKSPNDASSPASTGENQLSKGEECLSWYSKEDLETLGDSESQSVGELHPYSKV